VVGINYYDQIEKAFDYFTEGFEEAQGIRILMLHHFIAGYNEVPPYSECLSLDKLAEKNPDFVFTGHYHRKCEPKQLPNGGWVLTPGSLEMYDFAELPDKGFYFIEVNDKTPRFEWESLEPLHVMKQVNLTADRRRPPKWYINKIKDIVNEFVDELKKEKKEGYIRIVVKGQLSQGFPGDVSTKVIEEIVENEPLLLWVDIETMRLDLPTMVARFEKNSNDISEFFKDFGDFHTDIREMHIKVRETLENEGSERTGLLTPTSRSRFIKEWVERFESLTFKEIDE
jgi:DNA repair exonuclease SbcCD nuclease subunit